MSEQAQNLNENEELVEEVQQETTATEDPLEEAIARVQELEEQLKAQVEETSKKEQDLLLRTRAEIDNMRRRSEQDVEKAHKFALEKFSKDILNTIDNLERALATPANKEDENIIIGNVALYGATSGKAYINGVAGERFCVRNSGARTVVEGTGDHGCEYMTGGCAVILGKVGKNFAAGMSGGIAYVLDEDSDLYMKVNKAMVTLEEVTNKYDVQELKDMIQEHVAYTNSERGKQILDNFEQYLPKFKKIIPNDYKKMLSMIVQMEEKGMNTEQAQIEAFYAIKRG